MGISTRTKEIVAIILAVILIAAVGGYFAWRKYYYQPPPTPATVETPVGEKIENPDLGSQVYEQAKNPVKDKLPESVAPAPNPLKDIYKNPFE